MTPIKVACVVEGHGEVQAVPTLLRRLAASIDSRVSVEILRPIRIPRGSLIHKPGELERAVQLAALKARPRGGVIVLLDSDDDCPAELGPALLARGKRGLPGDLETPPDPEEIRGAKGWLRERMPKGRTYAETIDQPALAAIFDLNQARATRSFDKCYREIERMIRL